METNAPPYIEYATSKDPQTGLSSVVAFNRDRTKFGVAFNWEPSVGVFPIKEFDIDVQEFLDSCPMGNPVSETESAISIWEPGKLLRFLGHEMLRRRINKEIEARRPGEELTCHLCGKVVAFGIGDFNCTTITCPKCATK